MCLSKRFINFSLDMLQFKQFPRFINRDQLVAEFHTFFTQLECHHSIALDVSEYTELYKLFTRQVVPNISIVSDTDVQPSKDITFRKFWGLYISFIILKPHVTPDSYLDLMKELFQYSEIQISSLVMLDQFFVFLIQEFEKIESTKLDVLCTPQLLASIILFLRRHDFVWLNSRFNSSEPESESESESESENNNNLPKTYQLFTKLYLVWQATIRTAYI